MTKLSVNVNKFATLRNSRGKDNPDVLKMALQCVEFGAQGITVHPRPDERHIRKSDVFQISEALKNHKQIEFNTKFNVEFNVEGYPSDDYLAMSEQVRPSQCTLVPDPPDALTSNAGWNALEHERFLTSVVQKLKSWNIRVSLFMDPHDIKEESLKALRRIGAHRIELYTEEYALAYATPKKDVTTRLYVEAASAAIASGLEINAGHDLSLENLSHFAKSIPNLKEVSIGHALVCDALTYGLKETVRKYLDCLPS